MKKFLFVFALLLSIFSFQAKSQDIKLELDSLNQKVDSLEHELLFLKLSYEITTINTDISLISNEVYNQFSDIKLAIYTGNYNKKSLSHDELMYEQYNKFKDQKNELLAMERLMISIYADDSTISQREFDILNGKCTSAKMSLDLLESNLELLNESIKFCAKKY